MDWSNDGHLDEQGSQLMGCRWPGGVPVDWCGECPAHSNLCGCVKGAHCGG